MEPSDRDKNYPDRPLRFDEVVSPITDAVIAFNRSWQYLFLNDAALRTHPLGREATLGKTLWEVHPEIDKTVFGSKFKEAMSTGKVVEVESFYLPMNAWFYVKVYPTAYGITIFYIDITVRKRAEDEVLHSTRILENTADSIWSVDTQYNILFCNNAFRNLVNGMTGKEVQIGDNLKAFIPPEYSEWIDYCRRALGGESFEVEQVRDHHDRRLIQELIFNPIRNDEGIVSGVSVYIRDITGRRKAELDFQESERRYHMLIEQLSDAVFVADEKGNYIDVNNSACKLLGYTREELLTMGGKDIVYSPERVKALPSRLEKLRSGKAVLSENQLKRKDGGTVDVEVNSRMISDGRFVGIVRDITDRKRAQAVLDKRERRFRAMIENSDDIITLLDKQMRPLYRSPSVERITGYNFEESMDDANFIVHPDDTAKATEWISEAMRTPGSPVQVLFRCRHKEGHFLWLEGTFTNLFNDPNVESLVTNLRDVSARMDAQQKVLSNEKRFRALIQNISDGIVMNDEHSNLIFQSKSVERILGYTFEERQHTPVREFVHPDYRAAFDALYVRLRDQPGQSFPFQYRFLHKNGQYIWLEGFVTNLLDQPEVQAYVANYRNITDRKWAEDKLTAERTLLRTLIDNLPDYIYAKDKDFKYLVNNKSQLEYLGLSHQEQTLGKTASDILGADLARNTIHDDQLVLRSGQALVDKEEMSIAASGEPEFWMTTKVPMRDAMNRVVGLVGISRNITRQKNTELQLRNSNYFLESAQRAGKIGYWISDISSGVLTWSKETCLIFGTDPAEFDGTINTFYALVHPDDREMVRSAAQASVTHRQPYSVDHRIVLIDATEKWVHQQGEVTFDELGKPVQLLGVVQDITDRKNAEQEILTLNAELEERVRVRTEQLQAANKEMEAFTYSVSHDLRSPLRIIDGYAQILVDDYQDKLDADGVKSLSTVMANARKMGKLIDDLLDFSRIGRAEIKRLLVPMDDVVKEVIGDLRMSGVKIPSQLVVRKLPPGMCDPNLIRHVWMNLISNAVKYSSAKEDPIINIDFRTDGDKSFYCIQDNGAGFDMKYYHKLFGVFQRLHSHHEFSGTGVGLAIVQRIIVRHGGAIWADAHVGKGATFCFSLE